jgi:uncharacterized protein
MLRTLVLPRLAQTLLVITIAAGLLMLLFSYQALIQAESLSGPIDRLSTFTTIFLGIFIEAAPFLLLGTLASGMVEVFFRQDDFARLAPRNPLAAALFGSLMGFFFPVCECGVIPLTRRLFHKGLPHTAGIAFLLASPVVNPIVIASTIAAFGVGTILYFRVGLSLIIAALTGLFFAFQKDPRKLLRPASLQTAPQPVPIAPLSPNPSPPLRHKFRRALTIAADEFFEMGRFLILGALLAALMQTFIPQSALLSIGQGALSSVLVMMALAVLLSICSTVDAFIALSFVNAFSPGSILAFLVFGPMVDIKSTLMYLQVFRPKTVVYIVMLPFLMTILAALLINLYM